MACHPYPQPPGGQSRRRVARTRPGNLPAPGEQAQPVPDDTAIDVQAVVASGRPSPPWPKRGQGMRVRIIEIPLAGVPGVILRKRYGKKRPTAAVEL